MKHLDKYYKFIGYTLLHGHLTLPDEFVGNPPEFTLLHSNLLVRGKASAATDGKDARLGASASVT